MKIKYNTDRCAVELSARTLCELTLDVGGLDSGRRAYLDAIENEISAAAHKKLIAKDKTYGRIGEILINTSIYSNIYFTVSARAARISSVDGMPRVDIVKNIKKTRKRAYIPDPWTLAYLKILAYFLAVERDSDSVCARIVGVYDDGELDMHTEVFDTEGLRIFYTGLLAKAEPFAALEIKKRVDIHPALKNAKFPYPTLREGQEIMIKQTHSAIKHGKKLFVEAPTGTGKTVSSLYPAVKAIGDGYAEKIFYLTAKSSTRREAYAAAGKLFASGAKLKTIVLNAKEQMCICPAKFTDRIIGCSGNHCNSLDCEYAAGYYERSRLALLELFSRANGYPGSLILEVAKKYKVCPYELSLDLSEYCEIVICDYNYVFDPSVYLKRYFDDNEGKYVFLIDEAHNLADRARDMYSAELRLSDVDGAVSACENNNGPQGLIEVRQAILALRSLCKDTLVKNPDGSESGFYMNHSLLSDFGEKIELYRKKIGQWLCNNREDALYPMIYELDSKLKKYIYVSEYFDKGFLSYVEINNFDIRVKIFCLAPSGVMKGLLSRATSSVLFSATLTPPEYFCDVLVGKERARTLSLPSAFPPENLCVAVMDGLSVRLDDRELNASAFARIIAATASRKNGNYIAYFPSYECLEKVLSVFKKKYPKVETVVQKSGMLAAEREEFLQAFKTDGHTRVGFCVLGGVFSEGVDLPGSRLIGAIIFGVGLPGMSNEKNIIKEYFDAQTEQGYDYAYTFAGMNNVLQAVGRVIRTEEDIGVAVLVDDRYTTPKYRQLFPKHWQGVQYAGNVKSLAEILRRFWGRGAKT